MTWSSVHLKWCLALVLAVLNVSACNTTPLTATSPIATITPALYGNVVPPSSTLAATPGISPVATITANPSPAAAAGAAGKAAIADWEEMFRTTQSYEYAQVNGQPGDKKWWTEQARRFYSGKALANQLQLIEFVFSPRSAGMTPGFVENAHYTVQVEGCSSNTDCTLKIHMQEGKYFAYDISRKTWNEANPVEPSDWTVSMRYDPAIGHWRIN
jgi:hypothetical protein